MHFEADGHTENILTEATYVYIISKLKSDPSLIRTRHRRKDAKKKKKHDK